MSVMILFVKHAGQIDLSCADGGNGVTFFLLGKWADNYII